MKKITATIALSALLLLASCGKPAIEPGDIRLVSAGEVTTEGVGLTQMRLRIDAAIANDSRHPVTVRTAELSIADNGTAVTEITLREAVSLPRQAVTEVSLPIDLRFKGPLGMLGIAALFTKEKMPDLRVSGQVVAGTRGFYRTLPIEEMPLKTFLTHLGINDLQSPNLSQ